MLRIAGTLLAFIVVVALPARADDDHKGRHAHKKDHKDKKGHEDRDDDDEREEHEGREHEGREHEGRDHEGRDDDEREDHERDRPDKREPGGREDDRTEHDERGDHPGRGPARTANAENVKHEERLAKLQRLEEVATAQKRPELVQKVRAMRARETKRHEHARARLARHQGEHAGAR